MLRVGARGGDITCIECYENGGMVRCQVRGGFGRIGVWWNPSDYGEVEIRHLPFIGRPVGGLACQEMLQILHLHSFEKFTPLGRDKAGAPMTVLCIVITSRYEALSKGGVKS